MLVRDASSPIPTVADVYHGTFDYGKFPYLSLPHRRVTVQKGVEHTRLVVSRWFGSHLVCFIQKHPVLEIRSNHHNIVRLQPTETEYSIWWG